MQHLSARTAAPGAPRRALVAVAVIAGLVAGSTLVVAVLENAAGLPDASSAYLPAVVIVAAMLGTIPAVVASIAAFLVYDFLFVAPTFTFTVDAPTEWLSLLLFLIVAVVVGRLTALLAQREREASQRAREARVLFAVSLDLATAPSLVEAVGLVAARLRSETRMSRVWCGLGPSVLEERVVADTLAGMKRPAVSPRFVLERDASGGPRGWVRVREPVQLGPESKDANVYRVPLVASGRTYGSLWASRERTLEGPSDETTRFLVASADQIAAAVERERLASEATEAEIARQSDALKSALLDSVSHDLRTPLAAIRVAAGHLADPAVEAPRDAMRASARTIESEAARLDRLVTNVLDLSRIEGGALHAAMEPYDLADLVEQVVDRLAPVLAAESVLVEMPDDLPPVLVDPILVDQVLTNLLENAVAHAGPARTVRIAAARAVGPAGDGARGGGGAEAGEGAAAAGSAAGPSGFVELVVEDSGAGVPPAEMEHLFEKFYRASPRRPGGRGLGIGLAVVRGLTLAMGGTVVARRSALGGLAIAVTLAVAHVPEEP